MQVPTWYGPDIQPEKLCGEPRKVLIVHQTPDDVYEISSGYCLSQAQWLVEGKLQPASIVRCWTFLPAVPTFGPEDIAAVVDFCEARFTPPVPPEDSKS
jgi:hypothetical protein